MSIKNAGWMISAGMIAVLAAGGFQGGGSADKVGAVDMGKIINGSQFYAKQKEKLNAFANARRAILEYVNTYPVLTSAQAATFRTLSTKDPVTAPDKTKLEALKKEIEQADKQYK